VRLMNPERKHKRDRFNHTKTEHDAPKQDRNPRSKEKRLYRACDVLDWGNAINDYETPLD
jgi:hypothetical protein